MSDPNPSTSPSTRGRGRSRGGLGKRIRASARGRGRGRPAEFGARLVLEDEQTVELDEDEVRERQAKYGRRALNSNADRYAEPEPDPEDEPEPEVDLTGFLAKQRAADDQPLLHEDDSKAQNDYRGEEIDESLIQFSSAAKAESNDRKGNVQKVEWTAEMETMHQEMQAADAIRDLKSRLQGSSVLRNPPNKSSRPQKRGKSPVADHRGEAIQDANSQGEMEAFLDDLLS